MRTQYAVQNLNMMNLVEFTF